ncbi:ATP-binding cassette domain-containing protein [Achromobacter xylosoxidans]
MADMRTRLALKAVRSARLAAVDLALAPGECAAVMGPSGSGKSLLLRQVADLDPGEGEVELDGAPRSGMAGYEWRRHSFIAGRGGLVGRARGRAL